MLHGDTPWAAFIDEIVSRVRTEVVAELRSEFGPRHDRIVAELAETRRELAKATRRLGELEERNSFLEAIAQYLGGKDGSENLLELITAITRETPRPPSIDRACAVDPKYGAQRVDLPQYGLVAYTDPNSPPEVTWGSLQSLPHQGEGIVNDDERQGQAPHSPRATRN